MSTHSSIYAADQSRVVSARSAYPSPRARLVLTRRGRVVVLMLALVLLIAMALTFGSSTSASDAGGTQAPVTSVTVKPGQTVWDIAAKANPHGDLRHTVDRIMKLNSLPDASGLQMGEVIAVPAYR